MRSFEAADRSDTFVPHAYPEPLVDLGEVRMNYVVEGDPQKPALLLIPGNGDSWWTYEDAISLLSPNFQVYAVDVRGHGRSSWTPGRYTIDNVGNDLVRFIDLVIGRPTLVAGNSAGGVFTAWLAAYAKPGQLRGVILEDAPLFTAQAAPAFGPGSYLAIAPLLAARHKWLGNQWSIGDYAGLMKAMPTELPADMVAGMSFMFGKRDTGDAVPRPPQNMGEYDPEWAGAWADDSANAGCDHAAMLAQVRVPVLFTHHGRQTDPDTGRLFGAITDLQAQNVCHLIESAGQPVTYVSLPDAAHSMHSADAKRYVTTMTEWIDTLD
ncbi:alpha/beta hydrolase [Nocardia sp. 2]|uniref:Alpha/beta hydrolase n=1 Tax=Nocardia acididurans TaxID=2802282 RepID=A0ABS1M758_9NOCA|nr:alpha/beta hydrolase [Nocardia acididurans]MBL1076379.1 alpha/beta hydrolase [Nocardia acididurans]